MEDKRVFARFQAQLPIRFLDLRQNKESLAKTQDVSTKGVGMITAEELLPRTPLEMWLEIPDKGEPLYARGEVIWSKRLESDKYRIGVSLNFRVGVNLEKADLMGMSRVLRIVQGLKNH